MIQGLSKMEGEGMWDWAQKLEPPWLAREILPEAAKAMANLEGTDVPSLLKSTEYTWGQSSILAAWANRDPAACLAWAAQTKNPILQSQALSGLLGYSGNQDPKMLAQVMPILTAMKPGKYRQQSIETVVASFGKDAAAAWQWASQLPEFDQPAALKKICQPLAQGKAGLAEATKFLQTLPEGMLEFAAAGVAGGLPLKDGVAWLQQVFPDAGDQKKHKQELLKNWQGSFTPEFGDLALSLSEKGELPEALRGKIWSLQKPKAISEVLRWSEGLQPGMRSNVLKGVLEGVATFGTTASIVEVIQAAAKIPDQTPEKFFELSRSAYSQMASKDAEAAKALVQSLPENLRKIAN
jgi:hypothetical protein